ncbi:MAG: hypothetical protein AAGC85_04465 [Bacteroidota bacterium]
MTLTVLEWGLLFLLIVSLVGLILFLRSRSKNRLTSQVIPAVLDIKPVMKKGYIKVKISTPSRDRQAKFTLYTPGGKPLSDKIVSGSKSRFRVPMQDLTEGWYFCDVLQNGVQSESKWFEWK